MKRVQDFFRKLKIIRILEDQVTDPIKFRRLNGWLVVFWTFMVPFSIISGLWTLVIYISLLSIYANWVGHLGVWAASRAEVKADVDVVDVEANHAKVKAEEVEVEHKPG